MIVEKIIIYHEQIFHAISEVIKNDPVEVVGVALKDQVVPAAPATLNPPKTELQVPEVQLLSPPS
jgi:hypothetical protein